MADRESDNKKQVERKLKLVNVLVTVAFLVLVGRLWQLQIVKGEEYTAKSVKNMVATLPISAPRGNIYDRNGEVIANSRMAFTISLVPQDLYQSDRDFDEVVYELSELIDYPAEKITSKVKEQTEGKYAVPYQPVRLVEDASIEVVTRVEEQKINLPGVIVEEEPYRNYPLGATCGPIIGYVGQISSEELNELSDSGYKWRDRIGKTGIERTYESYLRGEDGQLIMEIDSRFRPMGTLGQEDPVNGAALTLTIDVDVQTATEKALSEQLVKIRNEGKYKEAYAGAAVVLNPNTGEVIALSTMPGYDPNLFSPKISQEDWDAINAPVSGLFNRAVSGAYPPGSVFKPITAAAALEAGVVNFTEKFSCTSNTDRYFGKKCMSLHGSLNLLQGMSKSCNAVFYELGLRLTADKIADMSKKFGLSYITGIDLLPKESVGKVPDSSERRFTTGEVLNYAIGQQVSVTPLQMAVAYGGIATKGTMYKPFLVSKVQRADVEDEIVFEPEVTRTVELSDSTWNFLHESLRSVVTSGTAASAFKNFPISVAGKTGTAQAPPGDDHGWFIGWAPAENPEIVVAVMIERGGGGGANAAPVARTIMESYFKVGAYAPN